MLLPFSETYKPSVVPDPQHCALTLPFKVESLVYWIIIAIEHHSFLEVSPNLQQAGSSPAGRYLDHCLCWYLVVFLHILKYCAGLAPCWLILFNPILCCHLASHGKLLNLEVSHSSVCDVLASLFESVEKSLCISFSCRAENFSNLFFLGVSPSCLFLNVIFCSCHCIVSYL